MTLKLETTDPLVGVAIGRAAYKGLTGIVPVAIENHNRHEFASTVVG